MDQAHLQIREARLPDQVAIRALTLAAYEEYSIPLGEHWDMYRQNILATLASADSATQIVAVQDGAIVGAVLLYAAGTQRAPESESRPFPEVRLLAVPPALRGRGIARALMDECIRRARRSGAPAMTLHTSDMMQTAMLLYERMGFVRAPELDFYPAPGLTVKGFRLELDRLSR
jgi:ribosomal protein S18 acetylase RimI-like enzyme